MKKLMLITLVMLGTVQLSAQENSVPIGKWQARFRLVSVIPDESATIQTIGGDVDISTAFIPELDFTYFFNNNLAVELILGTANHDVKAIQTAAGEIDLGDVWLLPPTLTLQYHFTGNKLKPYVGAGINYTFFYNVDNGPTADEVEYDNSFGLALQGGFDFALNDKWFLNLDAKKLFLQTDATINATTALNATVGADVDINPWIVGFGVGMKF